MNSPAIASKDMYEASHIIVDGKVVKFRHANFDRIIVVDTNKTFDDLTDEQKKLLLDYDASKV